MGQTNQTLQDTNRNLSHINETIRSTKYPMDDINQTLKNNKQKNMFFQFPLRIINMNKVLGVRNMCEESKLRIFTSNANMDEQFTNPIHCQAVFDKLSAELQTHKLHTNPCMCGKYH